jgi:hypothetical protein
MVGKVMISMVALLLVSVSPAEARINPKYLKQAQRYAPEKLVLQVLKVSSIKQGRDRVVNATAEVKEVRESATGLKVGDRIKITYTSRGKRGPGWTGPMSIPVLSKGETGAFLSGANGVYRPAARAYSFASPQTVRKTPTRGKRSPKKE